jgi:Putative adhesin
MKTNLFLSPLVLAAALALAPSPGLRADDETTQIAFSDPSKPGTLRIRVIHGDVAVHGADVKEIAVKSESTAQSPTPRKDGMRVLSASSGYVLSEKGNVVTLEYGADGWSGGSADFDITVPRSTSVIVANSLHGSFDCTGLSGDIDVKTMSGDVTLNDVSGGALVETMNGEIKVDVKSLAESRPLSFTSMHGEITIHLPKDSKANVRFRTHRGVILTNFDEKALVTKTEISHGRESDKEHMKTAVLVAPSAPADASMAAKGAADASASASASTSDDDWHAQVRDQVREAVDEAAVATHEALEAVHEGLAEANIQMSGMVPPLPPMTGGKVVSGTLNGGGVEIQAATLTGDIILKKSD